MTRYTRLPKSLPQSLRYEKPAPSPLVKARVHQKRAERLRDEEKERAKAGETDPTKPHLQFLERMAALRAAQEPFREKTEREFLAHLAQDTVGPHEVLGHMLAKLPKAHLSRIMQDERIGKLNALILRPARQVQKVIDDNERLQDLGITFRSFTQKRRDLKIHLGQQSYKSAQALALYFTIIESAADPKVRKKANWVQDTEVLGLANEILRDVATHIIEHMQSQKDRFLDVGKRRDDAMMAKGGRKA